jgi:hypothetical protein
MKVQEAIAKFTTDPKRFLADNCVMIAGGTTRAAGMTIFRMSTSASTVQKAGKGGAMDPRPLWSVNISNTNGGNPAPGVALANDEFIAYYIPMKQQTDNVANTFGNPPSDGSVTFLVTSQLSGCTFGFSKMGGQFVASHLQPQRGVAPAVGQQNMANLIQSGLSGSGTLVEKGSDYKDYATIVGVFRHGEWKVYMQPIDWNPGINGAGFKEIKGVTKL